MHSDVLMSLIVEIFSVYFFDDIFNKYKAFSESNVTNYVERIFLKKYSITIPLLALLSTVKNSC
jgi:small-conductance mechanosensitive channel